MAKCFLLTCSNNPLERKREQVSLTLAGLQVGRSSLLPQFSHNLAIPFTNLNINFAIGVLARSLVSCLTDTATGLPLLSIQVILPIQSSLQSIIHPFIHPSIHPSIHSSTQATVMLTCLVATNPQARAHILSKVGNADGTQGSIEVSNFHSRVNQVPKGTSQGISEGAWMTTLSQSNDRDDTNQESNPAICQRVNQCSERIVPRMLSLSTISEGINRGHCTNEGYSQTSCQRLNNEGSKEVEEGIATIFQSIPNSTFNEGSSQGSKEGSNLETIEELDCYLNQESDCSAFEDIRQMGKQKNNHGWCSRMYTAGK